MTRAHIWLVFMLVTASLGGCIVVPYPASSGYDDGSRQNLLDTVPSFIVPGKTTRADMFLTMGEPDGAGKDATWFVYSATYHETGLGLFYCVGAEYSGNCYDSRKQMWDYRRLVVRFDANGIVSDTNMDKVSCIRWAHDYVRPSPCLDLKGMDLQLADQIDELTSSNKTVTKYPRVRWPADPSSDCIFNGELIVSDTAIYFLPDASGPFRPDFTQATIGECTAPKSIIEVDYAKTSDISVVAGLFGYQSVKVSRPDESHVSFQIFQTEDVHVADDSATRNAATLIAEQIKIHTGNYPVALGAFGMREQPEFKIYSQVMWCPDWTYSLIYHPFDHPLSPHPCAKPLEGYLILNGNNFVLQLDEIGSGIIGSVKVDYADMDSVKAKHFNFIPLITPWVVVETRDGQTDAFYLPSATQADEINTLLQSKVKQNQGNSP